MSGRETLLERLRRLSDYGTYYFLRGQTPKARVEFLHGVVRRLCEDEFSDAEKSRSDGQAGAFQRRDEYALRFLGHLLCAVEEESLSATSLAAKAAMAREIYLFLPADKVSDRSNYIKTRDALINQLVEQWPHDNDSKSFRFLAGIVGKTTDEMIVNLVLGAIRNCDGMVPHQIFEREVIVCGEMANTGQYHRPQLSKLMAVLGHLWMTKIALNPDVVVRLVQIQIALYRVPFCEGAIVDWVRNAAQAEAAARSFIQSSSKSDCWQVVEVDPVKRSATVLMVMCDEQARTQARHRALDEIAVWARSSGSLYPDSRVLFSVLSPEEAEKQFPVRGR